MIRHYNTFQDQLSYLNPLTNAAISKQSHLLSQHGVPSEKAVKITEKVLIKSIDVQGQIRSKKDLKWNMIKRLMK